MNLRELEAQAAALAPVIKMAVAQATGPLHAELKQLRLANEDLARRLDSLPQPEVVDLEAIAKRVHIPEVRHGRDAEPVDLDALAKAAAALVVLPQPIQPDLEAIAALVPVAEKGKDAEPIDLDALAKAAAALVVLPKPIPGKDAEVDLDALAKAAAALVVVPEAPAVDLEAVAALVKLPEVKDGKDADPVDLEAVAALVKLPELEKVDVDAIARAAAALVPVPEVQQPQDGRDAVDLEILPSIDEAKQYPRGTYAEHRGGLWKSFERTHGMRGWECVVDGLDAVNIVQNGDREFSVTLAKSSGREVVQKFVLPIQVYKGVFKDGEAYEAHDNVTWGGSQWTSTKAENTDKPGSSDAWTLTVKAGRPGKDLRENASTFDASKGVKLK